MIRYNLNYISVEGGSGMVTVSADELPFWLADRHGARITRIAPESMDEYDRFRAIEKAAAIRYANEIIGLNS